MKNKIFSLIAVMLFSFSLMSVSNSSKLENLETNIETNDPGTCFFYANKWATIVGFWNQLSHEEEYNLFNTLYDNCMDQ